ncbi:MAG: DUF2818 family protein [Sphingomonadaceae bacterium]
MDITQAVILNLGLALLLANVPFLRLATISRWHPAWTDFIGWLVAYAMWMSASLVLEAASGKVVDKNWELWAITSALFAVLSFPGIVWRHLLQR